MEQTFEKIERKQAPALDEIIGQPFKVLDDGFVRVVEYMGTDQTIVQAARVSYGQGTKKVREDRALIRYLLRHRHTSPFEMCEIMLHVRVPMDCWRQWIRHRTANVNEYSTRYSIAINEAQKTPEGAWRLQATSNKQGSEGFLDLEAGKELSEKESQLHQQVHDIYHDRIEKGIAREQARKDLPLSTYTEAYWKMDLNNLVHFLELRMHPHAQKEIRDYATTIGEQIVSRWVPLVWEAYQDYVLNTIQLSPVDQKVMTLISSGKSDEVKAFLEEKKWLTYKEGQARPHYERAELEDKLIKMGISIPW